MCNEAIKVGLDIGNKNLKVCADVKHPHEIPVAYREVTEYDYEREIVGDGTEKVFYNGKYYFVGLQCQGGLPQNKGDKNVREVANMFKLVGLARELRRQEKTKAEFLVVTGTPVNDFEEYRYDYLDLMLGEAGKGEIIELGGIQYEVKVVDADITKQSACIAPTIPDWKKIEFLLVDFGGGTLDIAHFQNGVKKKYQTINFPLNEKLEELGNTLNIHKLGLPRPNMLDSGFIKIMEDVVLEGKYQKENSININGEQKDLKEFCSEWFKSRVSGLVQDIKIKFSLSETDCKHISVFYVGGGAKLLENELNQNKDFVNKKIVENPHFTNVLIYLNMANSKKDWK